MGETADEAMTMAREVIKLYIGHFQEKAKKSPLFT